MSAMELRLCVVRGSKVKIVPERLAAFQGAPMDVQDALEKLKAPPRGRSPVAHVGCQCVMTAACHLLRPCPLA